jgi:hypothetical protein
MAGMSLAASKAMTAGLSSRGSWMAKSQSESRSDSWQFFLWTLAECWLRPHTSKDRVVCKSAHSPTREFNPEPTARAIDAKENQSPYCPGAISKQGSHHLLIVDFGQYDIRQILIGWIGIRGWVCSAGGASVDAAPGWSFG